MPFHRLKQLGRPLGRTIRFVFFASGKPKQPGRYSPRLMRFPVTLILAFTGATLAVLLAFLTLAWALGANVPFFPNHQNPKTLVASEIYDLTRSAIAFAALGGAVFAAVYAYRKQRVEEAASRRTDEEHLSTRYQDAADQLGNDKAAVRLAGVYAISRLADDWPEQRQTCINVLCAYFRMHKKGGDLDIGEKEVRSTILNELFDRLNRTHLNSWRGYDYPLRGSFVDVDIYITDGPGEGFIDFSESVFSDCKITVTNPFDTPLNILSFEGVHLEGGVQLEVNGHYSEGVVAFNKAHLDSGTLNLTSIRLAGGTLGFAETQFTGANAFFSGARFDSGHLDFTRAEFTSGRIDFNHATFSSGVANFGYATYGSSQLTLEDVSGNKPQGLPKDKWQPKAKPSNN